tara:strand:+ start:101 stop:769 length:669 start_codon:yes stop_codon:yes gene_type:complete
MNYRPYLIFLFLFTINNNLFAQSNITFGVNGVLHEDTLCIGDSISFDFWLVNNSNIDVQDSVFMNCQTINSAGSPISFMQIDSLYTSILPGDSLFINITDIVTYQSFNLGDNIIVIWPAFLGNQTCDTSLTNIYIKDCTTNIFNASTIKNEFIFYSQKNKNVIFNTTSVHPKKIYMYDALGKMILQQTTTQHFITVNTYKSGVYFIKLIINGQVINKKIYIN